MTEQGPPGHEPVGSAAEEAVRLLGALTDWAKERVGDADEHLATGAPECTYCPICRTVHVLREAGPEVKLHLAEAVAALMQAAASVVAAASSGPSPRRAGWVERIDLDDDLGDWPEEPEQPVGPEEDT